MTPVAQQININLLHSLNNYKRCSRKNQILSTGAYLNRITTHLHLINPLIQGGTPFRLQTG